MTNWIAYWKPDQFNSPRSDRLRYIASNQLDSVQVGDTVWIMSVLDGELWTLGRIKATKPVVSFSEAAELLGREPYDSKFHLVVPAPDAEPPRKTDISKLADQLRFISPDKDRDRLTIVDGRVNGQQLQTMRRLEPESANLLSEAWGSERSAEIQTFLAASEALVTIEADDVEVTTKVRTEQAALRRLLFGDAELGFCSLCGKEYPIELLTAAHIKPRSKCSKVEREHWQANVTRMCMLGCDALFERGFVSVQDGKLVVRHSGIEALDKFMAGIEGRDCPHWSSASTAYFQWHFDFWSSTEPLAS